MSKIKKKLWSWLLVGILLAGIVAGSMGAEAKSGTWKKDKKGWWYSYSDGTYAKNQWVQSGGKWYYFASNGYLETEGYRQGYWLGKDGAASTKNVGGTWKKSGKKWWFTDKTGWYPKKMWLKIDGYYYYFGADGYLVTNEWIGQDCVNANGQWVSKPSRDWALKYLALADVYNADAASYAPYGPKYALIYLDNYSTPELLMQKGKHGAATIVTFQSGKAATKTLNDGNLEYIPKSGKLLDDDTYKGERSTLICQLNSGAFKELGKGEGDTAQYSWKWDGSSVTQSEYEAKITTLYGNRKNSAEIQWLTYDELRRKLISVFNVTDVEKWKGTYAYSETDTLQVTKVMDDGIVVVARGLTASGESTFETKKTLYFEDVTKKVAYEYYNGGTSKVYYTLKSDRINVQYPAGAYAPRDYIRK